MKINIKGFTLIELLAVILILGIIALIAVPTVTKLLDDSKKGSFEVSIKNIKKAVSSECELNKLKGKENTSMYSIVDGKITPSININGELPDSGDIAVDEDCNVVVLAHKGNLCTFDNNDRTDIDKTTLNECIPEPTDESYFTFENGVITAYSNEGPKDVVIPKTIGDETVVEIGTDAFKGKSLTSVFIPLTVKKKEYVLFLLTN